VSITAVVALTATLATAGQSPPLRYTRWEKEVRAIERRLDVNPPKRGGIAFAGSSSIRLWDLAESFPNSAVSNVGFGGSEIRDCTFFVNRLALRFEPSAIVFYAGDNDIASGRTAKQVADDFTAFTATVHEKLPNCQIVFIAVKPSPKRWTQFAVQKDANDRVRKMCEVDPRLAYANVVTPMLGGVGKPLPELFVKDQLHLSEKGYVIWAKVLRETLPALR
jgi:lysophospholipase L1-like esterase